MDTKVTDCKGTIRSNDSRNGVQFQAIEERLV